MLTAEKPQNFIGTLDLPAPDVYIESTEIDSGSVTIFYTIEDPANNWAANDIVLDNVLLYVYCNDILYTESLSSIKKRNKIQDGKITSHIQFSIVSDKVSVRAFCGNTKVKGNEVSESVLALNTLVTSSYNTSSFQYFNKNKDLRLLDVQNNLKLLEDTTQTQALHSNLYISDTTNKRACFGFVFDIESYLQEHSKQYKILKNNPKYRENILKNSFIDFESIKFFKKNINIFDSGYVAIENSVQAIKMQDTINETKYLITSADDNINPYDFNRYAVKVKFNLNTNINQYLGNKIVDRINESASFIKKYKETFETLENNKDILNKKIFVFENLYEQYIENIKTTIETLADVFSFYTNKNIESYRTLLLSIFHPLSSRIELFEKLLNSVQIIENYMRSLLSAISNEGQIEKTLTEEQYVFEHEFKYIDSDDRVEYQAIDYNYPYRHGYEVISIDNSTVRYEQIIDKLKIITTADKNSRKIYESNKYFGTPSAEVYNKINHLSISFFDLDTTSYDVLTVSQQEKLNNYNELFIKLDQLRKFNFDINTLESYYFQVLYKNAYIKSISNRNNTSPNTLQITTVFDPNLDSKQKSLQYIADTGVQTLYYILNDDKFLEIPSNIYQYEASLPTGGDTQGVLPITEEQKNDPQLKGINIGFYNNFFEDKLIFSGQNYEIWATEETLLNNIYKNKLRLFNKYYILEKKKSSVQSSEEIMQYPFENELKQNIPTKYLNRNIIPYTMLITTEEI